MKTSVSGKLATRFILFAVVAAALALAFIIALPQPATADNVTPPPMPANLQVPPGNTIYFVGHAVGTQDYTCLPAGTGAAWVFHRPQATLFNDQDEQVTTHFLSPNPGEGGTARATWQHSRDTSTVWAVAIQSSTDPAYVASGAIPWLLLDVLNSQDGPRGGDKLSKTTYIQRLNTAGGVAPSTGCAVTGDVGKRAYVPYTADYYFYK